MRTFVEAVRLNGFSAAARSFNIPRSKVSKQVQALEASLGVQLLMRTTRSLHLTESGLRYYEAAQEVLADLERAEELAREGVASIKGVLRINAPTSFGLRVLGPLFPRFHALHPDVELQVALNDQVVDPVRGGFDLTIRIADLPRLDNGRAHDFARTTMGRRIPLVSGASRFAKFTYSAGGVPVAGIWAYGIGCIDHAQARGGACQGAAEWPPVERQRGPVGADGRGRHGDHPAAGIHCCRVGRRRAPGPLVA